MENKKQVAEGLVKSPKLLKEFSELTKEELGSLIKMPVLIQEKKSKKGQAFYTGQVAVGERDDHSAYRKDFVLEERVYHHIKHEFKSEVDAARKAFKIMVPTRFIKGVSKQGNEYFSLEIIFSNASNIVIFFDKLDLNEFKYYGIKTPYYVRERVLDLTELDL